MSASLEFFRRSQAVFDRPVIALEIAKTRVSLSKPIDVPGQSSTTDRWKKVAVHAALQRIPCIARRDVWVREDVGEESGSYSRLRVDELHMIVSVKPGTEVQKAHMYPHLPNFH